MLFITRRVLNNYIKKYTNILIHFIEKNKGRKKCQNISTFTLIPGNQDECRYINGYDYSVPFVDLVKYYDIETFSEMHSSLISVLKIL